MRDNKHSNPIDLDKEFFVLNPSLEVAAVVVGAQGTNADIAYL